MTANSPPWALQASSHSAQLFRQALGTLIGAAGGIVGSGDYAVTQNGTPNMSVNVAGGAPGSGGGIWVPGTTSVGVQGPYYGFNDATVNLAVAASNPTNPRIDIAVAQVQDAAYTGAVNSFQLAIVTGTAAGSPVAPATPASSLVLANISVAALATTVVTGNITDQRSQAAGGMPYRYLTGGGRGGKSIIATTETRTNAAFGLMTTPDRVQNVVLPTDGLICVAYQATWQESVAGAARAAIFIGANQLVAGRSDSAGPTVGNAQASLGSGSTINRDTLLTSHPGGVASWQAIGTGVAAPAAYSGDATTGQVIGGGNLSGEIWATGAGVSVPGWGPCYIFAAAGTYDISVQFNASTGNVVAKNRKLWVWTILF